MLNKEGGGAGRVAGMTDQELVRYQAVFYVLDRNAAERLAGSKVTVREPDVRAWAEAFVKHKERLGWKVEDIDEGLMLGWFANFIDGGDPPKVTYDKMKQSAETLESEEEDKYGV
jgi:hypothetical protein